MMLTVVLLNMELVHTFYFKPEEKKKAFNFVEESLF